MSPDEVRIKFWLKEIHSNMAVKVRVVTVPINFVNAIHIPNIINESTYAVF